MNCKTCEYCHYDKNSNGVNRYYCKHNKNPNIVEHKAASTLICKTKSHSDEMTRKRIPKWCPQINT